ncbi:MAG TPA: hypothetical protein VLI54_00445 [Bacillota bacterium]|nr:hypothetical protein [Bacillota bacterium]
MRLVPLLVVIPLIAGWLWMFLDMVNNRAIAPNVRALWILGFVLLSLPTAMYYYFTEYRQD